jgi:membrane protein implicated in regulation of membrane protease activity
MEAYYWFGIAAILIIIEIATLGLTTIWFAAGALIAGFLNMAGCGLWVQIGVGVIVSLVLLLLTRPWAYRYLNSRTQKTNIDSLIGEICLTTKRIDNLRGEGQVLVKGQEWTARSKDGNSIEEGRKVRITQIQGVKLIVEPEESQEV